MRFLKKENLAGLAVVGAVGGFALAAPTIASATDDSSSRHGNHAEPGDDHGRHHGAGHGRHGEAEPGDDHGGHGGHGSDD